MLKQVTKKNIIGSMGATFALGIMSCPLTINATENPFQIKKMPSGYQLAMNEESSQDGSNLVTPTPSKEMSEGKCGEGKCGEGMCGGSMDKMPEGACGNMTLDVEGMVMNANSDNLPKDCSKISEDVAITVSAGTKYAAEFNGTTFGFSQHQWKVKPCSRITVTFKNEDDVRHQWMVHNLPSYLYPQGMYHMEANGGFEKTGTFIVPSADKTYLVHCDLSQHMEKGMKAQLIVGNGSGNLPSIPGITGPRSTGDSR